MKPISGIIFRTQTSPFAGLAVWKSSEMVNVVLGQKNARAVNVDATLIAEAPKISAIFQPCEKIAAALHLESSR